MLTNWKTFKLIELYDISSGLSKSADEFGFGFPFLSFSTVFKNYFIPEELDQLVNTSKKERVTCSIKKGDVFLTRTSEVIEELGMSCVALKDYPNATFNGFTKRLRPKNDEVVNPQFMGYYLRNKQFRAELSAYSTLTTRASLNNGIIEKLKVTLPPLPIQQKIASILSSYDELIENNKQRIKLLEEMAEEIYKEWFVRLRFPGYEDTKMVDGLPEGWEKKSVIEIIKRYPAGKKYDNNTALKKGNVPILDQGQSGLIGYHNDDPSVLANIDDPIIIFANHTCYQRLIQFNFSAIQNILPFKSNDEYKRNIYWLHFATKDIIEFNDYKGHWPEFTNKKIILPDEKTARTFGDIIKPMVNEIYLLEQKNQLLQETRDLLLPRLISGKLSVEHLLEEEALGMVAEPRGEYK